MGCLWNPYSIDKTSAPIPQKSGAFIFVEENMSEEILETARCSIDHAKIKTVMPQNERVEQLQKYKGPILVMAAEKDCLFPAKNVLPQAKLAWRQSIGYLLRDRGHINDLSDGEKEMIIEFFKM